MGWIDEGIDPDETRATRAVAERLKDVGIDHIYSSPLLRARQTAEPLAKQLDKKLRVLQSFGEMRMGLWEGMTQAAIAASYPTEWKTWRNDPAALHLPDRETLDEVQDRVGSGLEKLALELPTATLAIFTHDVVVRTAVLYVLGSPASHYRRVAADNCAVNVLHYGKGKREVKVLNDTAHLRVNE